MESIAGTGLATVHGHIQPPNDLLLTTPVFSAVPFHILLNTRFAGGLLFGFKRAVFRGFLYSFNSSIIPFTDEETGAQFKLFP